MNDIDISSSLQHSDVFQQWNNPPKVVDETKLLLSADSALGNIQFENTSSNEIEKVLPQSAHNVQLSVFDVACYVMSKIKNCTTMKLQKLLYYCQAWYLVWNEKPLFKEQIEAWANGPVIRELYNFHKGLFTITENMMNVGNPSKLTDNQKADIDTVLDAYAAKTSQWLIDQTHLELPWKEARKGMQPSERGHNVITHQAMAEYYSSLYEQEV